MINKIWMVVALLFLFTGVVLVFLARSIVRKKVELTKENIATIVCKSIRFYHCHKFTCGNISFK